MTEYDGKVAFRPAAVNWRNRPEDVDLIVDVVRELGARFSVRLTSTPYTRMTTTYGGVLASSRAVYAWEKRAEISGVS